MKISFLGWFLPLWILVSSRLDDKPGDRHISGMKDSQPDQDPPSLVKISAINLTRSVVLITLEMNALKN